MNLKNIIYAFRPPQWIKNFFLFLPLIFGGKLFSYPENFRVLIAFLLFSGAASVVYLMNDLIDMEKDREHPAKRLRPIAAGKVSPFTAKVLILVLGPAAVFLSFALKPVFGGIVLSYMVFNFLYSRILKHLVIIDVFCIGAFFLFRVVAGARVADVAVSHWIVFMTALLALFLGFSKRRQEIKLLGRRASGHRNVLAKYNRYFIDQMLAVITSSIVVAYTLYTVDARTVSTFHTHHLAITIPFVYYGIFRYLYVIHRYSRDGDPTRVILTDRMMQVNLFLWIVASIAVIYGRL